MGEPYSTQSTLSEAVERPRSAGVPARPDAPLVEVIDLAVSFQGRDGQRTAAVRGVSLSIHRRQTLAVVGESGSGKSVTALCMMQLLPSPAGRIERGSIRLGGRDLLTLDPRQMRQVRGREIAMIFQEPMTSLNPVHTIGQQITEAIMLHRKVSRAEAIEMTVQAMREVGIPAPAERLNAYPHQFSGGMRQRVMIAMALACRPQLLLADEPTTALDVTIQAQILELLRELQREREMAIMLITHDLGVVADNADVVCVMYAGHVVEYARVFDLLNNPLHPYTRALLRCRPSLGQRQERLRTIGEIMDDPAEFKRLPGAEGGLMPWWPALAEAEKPLLLECEPDHWVACRAEKVELAHRPPNIAFRRHEP